eukprot:evm.model.NODE_43246_length_4069_cov_5.235684.1
MEDGKAATMHATAPALALATPQKEEEEEEEGNDDEDGEGSTKGDNEENAETEEARRDAARKVGMFSLCPPHPRSLFTARPIFESSS